MSSKKARERKILSLIYNESGFLIDEAESPDFVVRRSAGGLSFGVEVTEFYHSGPAARYSRVPGYTTRLLAGGKHIHKEDVQILQVGKLKIYSPDGKATEATGIVQQLPAVTDYVAGLVASIQGKDDKVARYRSDLAHHNLILLDAGDRFATVPVSELPAFILQGRMRTALLHTKFREILFVTRARDVPRRFIPLKQLLLLSEFFFLDNAVDAYSPVDSPTELLSLLAAFLHREGADVRLRPFEGSVEVLFGRTGLTWEDGPRINDYTDYPLPIADVLPHSELVARTLTSEFFAFQTEFRRQHHFTSNFGFDVFEPPQDNRPRELTEEI